MKIQAIPMLVAMAVSATAFAPSQSSRRFSTSLNLERMYEMEAGRPPMLRYPHSSYRGGYGMNEDKIEGGSRRTFDTTFSPNAQVELETDGRPLDANVEVWEGPNNTPAKMKLWSEDGRERPWGPVGFANYRGASSGSSMTVDNKAGTEFPLYASVMEGAPSRRGGRVMRIDGNGAQKSFSIPGGACVVEIWSEGFPYFADIEVWDGPNNIKQSAEIYADDGMNRPWSGVIEAYGDRQGATIQIKNPGPLEYPILVSVEPLGGYGRGYEYGGRDYYY